MDHKVFTTEGPIPPESLGFCQAHEHFFIDISFLTRPSENPDEQHFYDEEITLENFWWILTHSTSNRFNGLLVKEEEVLDDFQRLVSAGVESVIDCTPRRIGFNPAATKQLARRIGLKVVHGDGFYTAGSVPSSGVPSSEGVRDLLIRDLLEGFPEADYQAGFIGEIGTSWPLADFEERVLRGACMAQKETDAGLFIHPGYSPVAPAFIANFIEHEGVDPSRVVLCHCDSRLRGDLESVIGLAKRGFYVAYDTFGRDRYSPITRQQHPSDSQRIEWLCRIVEAGFLNQIHISTDVCWRTEIPRYGGYGRQHLYKNIVPRMRDSGFDEEELRVILVDNPARAVARPTS